MGFWRSEVIDPALDRETRSHIEEQAAWILREPENPKPYYHLALLCRMRGDRGRALGLLLEAVRLGPQFAPAHRALAEVYAVAGDAASAWKHARAAADLGDPSGANLLERHGVPGPGC